jgi:hypothetical protein
MFQLEVYIRSYGPPKLQESQFWEFQDSQLGNLGTKWHLGVGFIARTRNTIKGKVVISPKFEPWRILWVRVCPWFIHATKMLHYALINLLFSLCRFVWIIDLLVIHLNPHLEIPTRPFTLEVLQTKECTPTFYPYVVFTFELAIESIKKLGGVSPILGMILRQEST